MSDSDISSPTQFISVEKHQKDILATVITNIVLMIANRNYINKDKINEVVKTLLSLSPDDMVYKIPINFKGFKEYVFKIIPHSISTVNKASGISDFLLTYKNTLNMVVVEDVSKKARDDIYFRFPNSQVFAKEDLLINKVDNNLVPEHILLEPDQVEAFYEEYNVKKKHIAKINSQDPIAQYYNAKPGDIFKIIRPSETTGYVNSYRLVIKKDHI